MTGDSSGLCIEPTAKVQIAPTGTEEREFIMFIFGVYLVLQLGFGYLLSRLEPRILGLHSALVPVFYQVTLVVSAGFYLLLMLKDPGFVVEHQEQLVEHQIVQDTSNATTSSGNIDPSSSSNQQVLRRNSLKELVQSQTCTNQEPTQYSHVTPLPNISVVDSVQPPLQPPLSSPVQHSLEPPLQPQSTTRYLKVEKRYCRYCNLDQSLRTKHCHECNKCVALYDHHCPWISNCVGEKNRGFFYLFSILQSGQIAVGIFITVTKLPQNTLFCAAMLPFLLGLLFVTGSLMVFHSYLMLMGCTTWEFLKWGDISYLEGFRRPWGPFYQGICKNVSTFWYLTLRRSHTTYEWQIPTRTGVQ